MFKETNYVYNMHTLYFIIIISDMYVASRLSHGLKDPRQRRGSAGIRDSDSGTERYLPYQAAPKYKRIAAFYWFV